MENTNITKKRQRCANFTGEEHNILIDVAVKYKHTVENKRTEARIWREKELAWEDITKEFNSRNLTPRSAKTLKLKYEGIKKSIRKKKAEKLKENSKVHFFDYEKVLLNEIDCKVDESDLQGNDRGMDSTLEIKDDEDCRIEKSYELSDGSHLDANEMSDSMDCVIPEENVEVQLDDTAKETTEFIDIKPNLREINIDHSHSQPCAVKRKKYTSSSTSKFTVLTDAKLKLIKKEEEYLEKEDKRKQDIYTIMKNNLIEENKRKAEEHKLRMKILELELISKHLGHIGNWTENQ